MEGLLVMNIQIVHIKENMGIGDVSKWQHQFTCADACDASPRIKF